MGRRDRFKAPAEGVRAFGEQGTYCAGCALFMKKGRPTWTVRGKQYHHHCARYLPDPPPQTVCMAEDCRTSTSVRYAEDGEFEILPVCWLHARSEKVKRGLGIAGDIQRKAEQIEWATQQEQQWEAEHGWSVDKT